ncbi:MAG: hypothetical protein HYZ14_04510 [Bacteroidetes bacterium]|nr:hypothetical protein [Bacteroidota bacterium]
MAEEKSKNKKLQLLLADLVSNNIAKQLEAVESLRAHGNETVVEPLLDTWAATRSDELKSEIVDLLNNIKSSKVPKQIMACLVNKKYAAQKQLLLSSIWNSGLDYHDYIAELVEIACESDLLEVFEVETIIENLEGIPSDEVLSESLVILGNYLSEHKNESSPKIDLLIQIGVLLKRLNED